MLALRLHKELIREWRSAFSEEGRSGKLGLGREPHFPTLKFCISSVLTTTCKRPVAIYIVLHQVLLRDQGSGSGAPVHCWGSRRFQEAFKQPLQGITRRLSLVWLKSMFHSSLHPIFKPLLTTIHIFNHLSSQAPCGLYLNASSQVLT